MSRTLKDRPGRIKHEPWDIDRIKVEGWFRFISLPTTKTKKRRKQDTEEHWTSTPGWWTRIMMNKPQRRSGSLWERKAITTNISDLCLLDIPSVGRRPHQYYW